MTAWQIIALVGVVLAGVVALSYIGVLTKRVTAAQALAIITHRDTPPNKAIDKLIADLKRVGAVAPFDQEKP